MFPTRKSPCVDRKNTINSIRFAYGALNVTFANFMIYFRLVKVLLFIADIPLDSP